MKLLLSAILLYTISPTKSQWSFPDDFKFGVATAAYQIEGGWNADGKGVNVWDHLTHTNPNFTIDNSNGDIACDSYHKWQEDVQMLKNLGVDFYRFSLSWTRILPQGFASEINTAGVQYYNNLIDELIANGIEPCVTLFHWDSPQMFSSFGGYYNPVFVDLFANYARIAFKLFGDRVKTWITFNEPKVVCQDYNEFMGLVNEVYPNGVIEYLCTHDLLKAHAEAYHIYDNEFRAQQNGKVGITLNFEWSEPASVKSDDVEAAEQRRQFEFGLFASPIVYGNYPEVVIERVAHRSKREGFPHSRLPKFTLTEQLKLKGTYDFIGLNHYNSWMVKASPEQPFGEPSYDKDVGTERFVDPSWEDTEWDGKIAPFGLQNSLKWIKATYKNPLILITENGYPDKTGTLEDNRRINFLRQYLNATLQAIHQDQVNVKAYTVWSLMDNFEWAQGFTVKFGLYNVDFTTNERTRTAKKSVEYYRSVIKDRVV